MLSALEAGTHGVVLRTGDQAQVSDRWWRMILCYEVMSTLKYLQVRLLAQRIKMMSEARSGAAPLKLEPVTVTKVTPVGNGKRLLKLIYTFKFEVSHCDYRFCDEICR